MLPVDTMQLVSVVLSLADKVMEMLPNYNQRKKEEYHTLKTAYEEEKHKAFPHRDDNLVGIYRDRLLRFIADFNTEISGTKISALRGQRTEDVQTKA